MVRDAVSTPVQDAVPLAALPAHAAFGGYTSSGIGRENHRVVLDHYQQTKNLPVSCSDAELGFFRPIGGLALSRGEC